MPFQGLHSKAHPIGVGFLHFGLGVRARTSSSHSRPSLYPACICVRPCTQFALALASAHLAFAYEPGPSSRFTPSFAHLAFAYALDPTSAHLAFAQKLAPNLRSCLDPCLPVRIRARFREHFGNYFRFSTKGASVNSHKSYDLSVYL